MGVEVVIHPYLLGKSDINWITVNVPVAPTVRDCILRLGQSLPEFSHARILDESGALRPGIYVMLNHDDLPEEGVAAPLRDGDCIRLVYIMSGCC